MPYTRSIFSQLLQWIPTPYGSCLFVVDFLPFPRQLLFIYNHKIRKDHKLRFLFRSSEHSMPFVADHLPLFIDIQRIMTEPPAFTPACPFLPHGFMIYSRCGYHHPAGRRAPICQSLRPLQPGLPPHDPRSARQVLERH